MRCFFHFLFLFLYIVFSAKHTLPRNLSYVKYSLKALNGVKLQNALIWRQCQCYERIMSVIEKTKDLNDLCERLSGSDFITIDTEFLRDKTYFPKLCLVQISAPGQEAFAVDPLADGLDLAPLKDLLTSPDVTKVFHAARQDLEIFYNHFGVVVAPIFDTQVAAMVCGYGDSVGYQRLVQDICETQLDKAHQFTNWAYRTL